MEEFYPILVLVEMLISGTLSWARFKEKNASSFFYLLYFIFFGVAGLLGVLFPTDYYYLPSIKGLPHIPFFPIDVKVRACFLNIVVLMAFYVGESLFSRRLLRRSLSSKKELADHFDEKLRDDPFVSFVLIVSLIISVAGLFILIHSKLDTISIQKLMSYKMRTELRTGGSWLMGVIGSQFLALVMLVNYIAIVRKKIWALIIGVGVVFVLILSSGTRSYMLFFIGPIIFWGLTSKKTKSIIVLSGVLLFIAMPFCSEYMRVWRWSERRDLNSFIAAVTDSTTYENMSNYPLSEINIYQYFLNNAVTVFPDECNWLYGNTYRNILLFWLPSGLSGGNKIDTIYAFRDALLGTHDSYSKRSSMHPTFTGDCYINFGYLFFVPPLIWGAFFLWLQRKSIRHIYWNLLTGSTIVYLFMYLFRGSLYFGFFTFIWIAVYLYAIKLIYIIQSEFFRTVAQNDVSGP
jgi:hypothetical protein